MCRLPYISCRPMLALISGVLEMCVRTLGTHRPSCIGRPAWDLFMFVARGPQGAVGRATVHEPSHQGGRTWSHRTCSGVGALLSREVGPRATEHVAVPEPSLVVRRGPEPLVMWRHRSSP
jgi:hypothetical protein